MRTFIRAGLWLVLAGGLASAQPPAGAVKSKLTVTLPQADAELKIEGQAMKAGGKVREFESPALEAGGTYEYAFEASWRPNNYTVITRAKAVQFKAGDDVAVDLTKDDGKDKAVIRYVPTPPDIVGKMVELAKVTKDDVVFEPGCGDARLTIAAVKAGAKRGVGVDLDPKRVEEARANVKAAGLGDKVDIRLGDALDIKDLSDATLVVMYMGDEFNALIRPVLWKQLKPGARVVSHRFTFGDWKPDRTERVTGEDGDEYELHVWTVTDEVKKRAAGGK